MKCVYCKNELTNEEIKENEDVCNFCESEIAESEWIKWNEVNQG